MKRLYTHYSDDGTEHIGLLKINVNEFGCAIFNVLDGFANVANLQFRRECYCAVKAFCIESHCTQKVSWFFVEGKASLSRISLEGTSNAIASAVPHLVGEPRNSGDGHLEKRTVVLQPDAFVPDRNRRCNG